MTRESEACATLLQQRFGPQVLCDVVPVEGDLAGLLPEEREQIASAVSTRQREFAAGRVCAHRLLERLGCARAPLLATRDRTPLWPAGIVGSIAHDRRMCAVAVARSSDLAALGLDLEPDEPLEQDLWSSVCTPRELEALASAPASQRGRLARLHFAAKESTYKCLYPLSRSVLEFRDVEIDLEPAGDGFRARVLRTEQAWMTRVPLAGFRLSCARSLLAAMVLPAAALARRAVST